jgi:PKD repeat protein
MNLPPRPRCLLLALAGLLPAFVLTAATYLPISDSDLALGAPIIARASVVSMSAHLEPIGGEDRPVTLVRLQLLEAIKGSPGETFVVRLPGGRVGDVAWWIPGTPVFAPGQEVVLMLGPQPGHPGQLRLTEFGLSKFDLVSDEAGRKFAFRPAFAAGDDLVVSKRAPASGGVAEARDAESFLTFLRSVARGEVGAVEAAYAAPVLSRSKWANIGGREPGDCQGDPCLWRWFWDTGASPNAVLSITGTQTNLVNDEPKCGTDFTCDVQNAATAWHGVAATDIRLSGPSTPGDVTVTLDAATSQDGTTWTTPLGCEAGVIGLGGPGSGSGPRTYRGDTTFYAPQGGTVSMRKITCASGYSAATFRSAVLHEVGHVIGLAHPDEDVSIHSTTTQSDWDHAVMHSVITDAKPDTPQADDLQAVLYYYGTAAVGAAPVANFTFSPSAPTTGAPVSFSDTSTGGATGWNWDFGDSGSSTNTATTQSASHVFSRAQTYSVKLTAGSLNGSNAITRQVTVAPGASTCTPGPGTLCLNGGRFRTTMSWKKSDGTAGNGTAVGLTSDSGYFWFFDRSNIEAVVKVLNGCAVTTHYWVFAAGLTNVEATLTVVDTQNGTVQQYVNPQGTAFVPIQDTQAFATCP